MEAPRDNETGPKVSRRCEQGLRVSVLTALALHCALLWAPLPSTHQRMPQSWFSSTTEQRTVQLFSGKNVSTYADAGCPARALNPTWSSLQALSEEATVERAWVSSPSGTQSIAQPGSVYFPGISFTGDPCLLTGGPAFPGGLRKASR